MNDLMAELAEVVRLSEAATTGEWRARPDDAVVILGGNRGGFCINECPDASGNAALIAAAVNFLRTHHAELEAVVRDVSVLRETLGKVTAVAVTQLFATHPDDVAAAFPLAELQRISELSAPLAAANASVESMYREAWDQAMHNSAREG